MAATNAVSIGPDDMARVVDPVGEGLHSTGNVDCSESIVVQ